MATRSRVEVEALSQTRGQDEIEKGTVGEGIFSRFFKKMFDSFECENDLYMLLFGINLGVC
jgi:high-affinity nickel permease